MRIPAAFAVSVVLLTTTLHAQDLQFRTVMTSEALGLPIPGFTMTVAMKGPLTRIDVDVAGMWFSSIVDYSTNTMLLINHEAMTYTERADLRLQHTATGFKSQVRATGETREMAGLKVKRIIITSPVPSSPDDGRSTMMIQEMWVAVDAKLANGFRRYLQAMAASGKDATGQVFGEVPEGTFPVRVTLIMLNARPDEKVDVDAVLKGSIPADKIQMRMVMETSDIQQTEIDASHFMVPNGYVKASK